MSSPPSTTASTAPPPPPQPARGHSCDSVPRRHRGMSIDDESLLADAGCPFDCTICLAPGDCEDCLDCLEWGLPTPAPPPEPRLVRGWAAPLDHDALNAARTQLDIRRRVGLVLRRYRRRRGQSQAALARDLEVATSSLSRIEQDAGAASVARVDGILRAVGHRLAVVEDSPEPADGELPDESWGTVDLVARDRRGRRLPPFGRVTWQDPMDRRQYPRDGQPGPEWIWRRPRP